MRISLLRDENMNCPSCGTQIESEQKFCRSCGETLIAGGVPTANIRLRLFRMGLFTMFGSLIIAVTGSMLLHLDVVRYVGVIGLIIGIFIVGYAAVGPSSRGKRGRPAADDHELPKAETTRKLAPLNEDDFIPSVTERTTNLLGTPVSKG